MFLDPLTALIVSFIFLAVLVLLHVSLEITLLSSALLLALLSLEPSGIPVVFMETSGDPVTVSLVGASFGIMLLSQLYKETGKIEELSQSLSEMVKNSKLIVSVLPAVVGLLPVAGGALMSAPLVETEADNLKMKGEKKAYVNVWFRHTIFPVYPVSQVLILLSALTGVPLSLVILRQIPVVLTMVIVGYFLGLWRVSTKPRGKKSSGNSLGKNVAILTVVFSPILVMIIAVILLRLDVFVASLIGLALLALIAKPNLEVLRRTFSNPAVYKVTLAAFGAMLLRNITFASGVSDAVGNIIANGQVNTVLILSLIPSTLAFLLGSPSGGIALTVPMVETVLKFSPQTASLLYAAAYLGYIGAPTHLCLVLTAQYFNISLNKLYKYMVPSLVASFTAAILVYFLV